MHSLHSIQLIFGLCQEAIKEARVEPLSTGGDRDSIQHVIEKREVIF
jgi:hypothetical protein